jgi:hypothetical protein
LLDGLSVAKADASIIGFISAPFEK